MFSRRSFLRHVTGLFALAAIPQPVSALASSGPCVETRLLMGTFVTMQVCGVPEAQAAEAMDRAFQEMARLEGVLTRHDSASPLGQLNTAGRLSDAPIELIHMTQAAAHMHKRAGGFFDPTILPMLEARESRAGNVVLKDAAELVGMGYVRMDGRRIDFERTGMKMSLDGIAKGHIADVGAQVLERCGLRDFLIDAGGDIVARGSKAGRPWKVAVQDPFKAQNSYPAVVELRNGAIATSGTYEKDRHIVDPFNGPDSSIVSATVMAPTAMEADALATSLCIMRDPVAFIDAMPGTACCIITADGRKLCSRYWKA